MLKVASKQKNACRFWIAEAIYYSYAETILTKKYTNYQKWMDYVDSFGGYTCSEVNATIVAKDKNGRIGECAVWDLIDADESLDGKEYRVDFGNWVASQYAATIFDRTTGIKVLPLYKDNTFRPKATVSVEEAISVALRYYKSFEPKAEYIKVSKVGDQA